MKCTFSISIFKDLYCCTFKLIRVRKEVSNDNGRKIRVRVKRRRGRNESARGTTQVPELPRDSVTDRKRETEKRQRIEAKAIPWDEVWERKNEVAINMKIVVSAG